MPIRRRLASLGGAALALCLVPGAVAAAAPAEVRVSHSGGRYTVDARLEVTAPLAAVRAQLTDYPNLTALNPSIRESRVLSAPPGYDARVATVIDACVQRLCQRLTRVEDIREGDRWLDAVIVPSQSSFRSGSARWTFAEAGDQALVRYRAELEPDFTVPPLLGPALIKAAMEREVRTLLANLERRLAQAATHP